MGCRHNDEYECNDCTEERHAALHPVRVDDCQHCRLSGEIQISPKATPSKRSATPPRVHENSWESGIARDERGMPFLGEGGQPIGVKEYGKRHAEIEAWRRRLKTDPTVLADTRS